MKVVLTKDVAGTGIRGDVKEVASGYFRNFLFPRGMAEVATPVVIDRVERQKAEALKRAEESKQVALAALKKLDGQTIIITAKATEEGHLFAGISVEKISAAIKEQKEFEIDPSHIALAEALKGTGAHPVDIVVDEAKATVNVEIKAEN